MKRLAFAVGLLAFGFTTASPARADFAVVEFNGGYCRIWTDTVFGPEDGHYLWFLSPLGGQTRRCIRLSPCIAVIIGGNN